MEAVEKHSELYWELSRVMAKTLADYRQNVAMISPFDHTDFSMKMGSGISILRILTGW